MLVTDYLVKYEAYFKKKKEEVLLGIKEAFINYYGEEYIDKINDLFNKLTIVFYERNYATQKLDYIISTAKDSYKRVLEILQKEDQSMTEEKIVNLIFEDQTKGIKQNAVKKLFFAYISRLFAKKERKEEKDYITYESINGKLDDFTQNKINSLPFNIGGLSYSGPEHNNLVLIKLTKGTIPVHYLIHEINHQFQVSMPYKLVSDDGRIEITERNHGITSIKKDFINELFNEYASSDMLEFYKKNNRVSPLLDISISSHYLLLDSILGEVVKKIYFLLKPYTKDKMISGRSHMVKNIINASDPNNYDELLDLLRDIDDYYALNYRVYKNVDVKSLPSYFPDTYRKKADDILKRVISSKEIYLQEEENLKRYVDELAEKGGCKK